MISQLPKWLADETYCRLHQEAWSDAEIFTDSGTRTLIQIKDHPIGVTELREILEAFDAAEKSRPGTYDRYILACCGTQPTLEHLPMWLDRIKQTSYLSSDEIAPIRADLLNRLSKLGLAIYEHLLVTKVEISADCAWVKDPRTLRSLFCSQLRDYFLLARQDAERSYLQMLARLNDDRGKPIDFQPIREEIRTVVNSSPPSAPPLESDDFLIPQPQNVQGRSRAIAELEKLLSKATSIVVYGISGLGKTTVAAQLARAYEERACVLWFDCEAYASVEEALYRTGSFLSYHLKDNDALAIITNPGLSIKRRIEVAVSRLEKHSCMLVWDGFSSEKHAELEAFIKECTSSFRSGRQIITAREKIRMGRPTSSPLYYSLEPLSIDDSMELLRSVLARNGVHPDGDELLRTASVRLGGHPLFLHLIGQQGHLIPLSRLIESLPDSFEEVSEVVNQDVYSVLPAAAQKLLSRLAVIGHPFRFDVVDGFLPDQTGTALLKCLLERGVVYRVAPNFDYYEIHEVVRNFARRQLSPYELCATHVAVVTYYRSLARLKIWELLSIVPHTIEANLREDLEQNSTFVIGVLQKLGAVELLLRATSMWVADPRFPQLWFVHFARGRAFRYKRQFKEALDEYDSLLQASPEANCDTVRIEIIITQLKLEDREDDFDRAYELYAPFANSNTPHVRVNVAGILGKIRAAKGDPKGFDDLSSALTKAELLDEPYKTRELANLNYAIGEVSGRVRQDYREAAMYIEKSLLLSKGERGECDLERMHCSYDWLMGCYRKLCDFEKSLQMAQASYDVAVQVGMGAVVPFALFQLAISQCMAGYYTEALGSLDLCLDAVRMKIAEDLLLSDVLEWRVVALWYSGNPERAFEEMYDYYDACAKDDVEHTQHMMILPPPKIAAAEVSRAVGDRWVHVLELPSNASAETVNRWREDLFRRKPHLRKHSNPLQATRRDLPMRLSRKVGRNEPCPCGSGKKSKKCCYR